MAKWILMKEKKPRINKEVVIKTQSGDCYVAAVKRAECDNRLIFVDDLREDICGYYHYFELRSVKK